MSKVTTTMMLITATTANITAAISAAFPFPHPPSFPCNPAQEHTYNMWKKQS